MSNSLTQTDFRRYQEGDTLVISLYTVMTNQKLFQSNIFWEEMRLAAARAGYTRMEHEVDPTSANWRFRFYRTAINENRTLVD
jgi:hypothetical protein